MICSQDAEHRGPHADYRAISLSTRQPGATPVRLSAQYNCLLPVFSSALWQASSITAGRRNADVDPQRALPADTQQPALAAVLCLRAEHPVSVPMMVSQCTRVPGNSGSDTRPVQALQSAAAGGQSAQQLRNSAAAQTVVGLLRDLRGIAQATSSRRTYGELAIS